MHRPFRLGVIINPFAGIGGALALKGSDGKDTREKALAMGAEQKAPERMKVALEVLLPLQGQIQIVTAAGEMGENLVRQMGWQPEVVYTPPKLQTEPEDTENTAQCMLEQNLDLLLFAGGDGTARNVCAIVEERLPVLGVPAGCKIHSGVYGVTPKAAGRVVEMMARGELLTLNQSEVMDIDEEAFRQGRVRARQYGEMKVPSELHYVQAVKSGGKESDELVITDMADYLRELIDDELIIMGSGSTVAGVMEEFGLDNTLLGVDLIRDETLLGSDMTASQLLQALEEQPAQQAKMVITLIGGQGHVFGRGNQQLSPQVIRRVGKENIMLVATKTKLQALDGRPLIVDTGDEVLNQELSGYISVITGYRDQVLYPIVSPGEES